MTRAAPIALGLVAAAASACAKEDLADASFVDGLRLIGVQAEPPEAPAGASVTLTAWVADPRGGSIDVSWSACLLPSNGLANNGCTDGSGNGLVGLGSGTTITATVPDVDPSLLGPPDASYGVYLPIVVHLVDGSEALDGVYRLRVRVPSVIAPGCTFAAPFPQHCGPNNNPTFTQIEPLGADETAMNVTFHGEVWGLLPDYDTPSAEEYAIPGSIKPTAFERLTTQWFSTAGSFPDAPPSGTGVQKWTLDHGVPAPGGIVDLWLVGHDDRGGTVMTHRSFTVVAP